MNWIKRLWARITLEIRYRKKLKELRKRDPLFTNEHTRSQCWLS
jgi:hypothetical protein